MSDENVPTEDKNKILNLLKKPWNPYIRRHTGLTEKSKLKYLNEHQLRQHAGWSINSKMPQKYIHYFGNESSDSLLEAYGLVTREQELTKTLHYKQCPHCNEPNKPDHRFCAKCKMVLTYDAYNDTIEKEKQRESELKDLKEKLNAVQEEQNLKFNQLRAMIVQNPRLANIKPEVLVNKSKH